MTVGPETLDRRIKLRSLFTLAFGTIIGVGWITVLGSWVTGAGSLGAIVAFLGGGAVMIVIGLCYAEVATMYPVSGGEVAYVFEAWGTRMSFAAGWFLAFIYTITTTFEAISVAWVVSALVPGFGGPVLYTIFGHGVRLWSLLLGLGIMAVITVINYRGGKTTAWFQDTMTVLLLVASLVFIAVGVIGGNAPNLRPWFVGAGWNAAAVGVLGVLATTPFWFAGFDTIPQAMGEVEDRDRLRLIPKVIVLAIGLAMVFYALVILTASMSLPRTELLALELPVAGALEAAFRSPWLGKLVLIAGLCGLITTWNAVFFAATRVLFSLGRAHMISHRFARVHLRFGSPAMAVLFVGTVGGLGTFLGRNAIVPIVNAAATSASLVFLLVAIGVIRLRTSRPDRDRPYRVPGGRVVLYIGVVFAGTLSALSLYSPLAGADGGIPLEWIALAVWAALGAGFWHAASAMRADVSELKRRWLLLIDHDRGPDLPTTRDEDTQPGVAGGSE